MGVYDTNTRSLYNAIKGSGGFQNPLQNSVNSFSASTVQPLNTIFSRARGPFNSITGTYANPEFDRIAKSLSGNEAVNGVPPLQQVLSGGQDLGSSIPGTSGKFRVPGLSTHGKNLTRDMPRIMSFASNEKSFQNDILQNPQDETNSCLGNIFGEAFGSIIDAGESIFNAVKDAVAPLINAIGEAVGAAIQTVTGVVQAIGNTVDQVMNFISRNIEAAVQAVRNATAALQSAIAGAVDMVASAVGAVVDKVTKELAKIAEIVGDVANKALASLLSATDDPCVAAVVNGAGSLATKTAFNGRLPFVG